MAQQPHSHPDDLSSVVTWSSLQGSQDLKATIEMDERHPARNMAGYKFPGVSHKTDLSQFKKEFQSDLKDKEHWATHVHADTLQN